MRKTALLGSIGRVNAMIMNLISDLFGARKCHDYKGKHPVRSK
jgi:hypothetical protein